MASPVRTRFAPSPTGFLHVGGARTALFNFLYARAQGGQFVLRIEDTDQARSTEQSLAQLVESMKWLELEWAEGHDIGGDYGPYRQSERLDIYQEHIDKLIAEKKAYRCFCTVEELEAKKKQAADNNENYIYDKTCANLSQDEINRRLAAEEDFVVRINMPIKEIVVEDIVQGSVKFDTGLIGDYIIVKSDGFPTYNFAVCVDDYLMKISHVIRGVGHLSNTPRQIAIYEAFGWPQPSWAHISEIVGSDRKKLSKRQGATAITVFRDLGYPKEAFINYITLLGWASPDEEEFLSLEKIQSTFDIKNCHKNPAMFDVFRKLNEGEDLSQKAAAELVDFLFEKSKLNHLSNRHIRDKSEAQFINEILPFLDEKIVPPDELNAENQRLASILLSLRVYLNNYSQINELIGDFYQQDDENFFADNAKETLKNDFTTLLLSTFLRLIKEIEIWQPESIQEAIKGAGKESEVKGKNLFMTLRVAATGQLHGMDLPVFIHLLGKERVIHRLEKSLTLSQQA